MLTEATKLIYRLRVIVCLWPIVFVQRSK